MPVKAHENTIHTELIDLIKKDCKTAHKYCEDVIGTLKDNKYSTFWIDKDEDPSNLIEYIVKNISYQDFPNGFPENYAGLEWWSQVRSKKEGIVFHYDKDEALTSLKNIYNYPLKSTVTYLTDIGGPTAIFKDEECNDGYLSFPKINKHILFDGHLFHGVIGPLGTSKPSEDLKRVTLLINYWSYRPGEPNCMVFPEKQLLTPLDEKHKELQESVVKEKSKIIKMSYKSGTRDVIILRNKVRHIIKLAKTLKDQYTYSFKFMKDCVIF